MPLLAMDLEGVLVPEIWIAVAERTGIPALRRTTRDEPDYDKLMRGRLRILDEHRITLPDIQAVIATLDPLPGATEFLRELRARMPVIILSDTFQQFAQPLLAKLDWPTLWCHSLVIDGKQRIVDYRLRLPDQKRRSVEALRSLHFRVCAVGDSYNDTTMLAAADDGILYRPSAAVARDFPQFAVVNDYHALRARIDEFCALNA
ncbi:MAG: bifunctional phosphoserine phosphatase/homoserine phosphotransferase ThrH [Planctomycetota bacterium]|nr:bifunctional phosphoserine phosphatase/homoserine phosphotransferase ThrH [Planctomycetota bacterium]